MRKVRRMISPTKQKILLLLGAGVALGFSRTPRQYFRVLKTATRYWRSIDEKYLRKVVGEFYCDRLVRKIERKDGTVEIVLSEKGKKKILEFKINEIRIKKPVKWDGKWRIAMFDVPEKLKYQRDVLREKLKDLKFYELQKSVFVHPYPCLDEINFVTEFYDMRRYVRCGEMANLTNEAQLKLYFKLK